VVVNAAGVFADGVRRLDDPDVSAVIAPSQGVHLVLDRSFLPGECAIMVPHTDDGRVLFAVPWQGRVIIGTTDTPVSIITPEPLPLDEEIDFLLSHAARYLASHPTRADVLSVFAGLRPLVKSGEGEETATYSREHAILVSNSGLVTIIGGKWTTYRKMGEDAVDRAADIAGLEQVPSTSSRQKIHGWCEEVENVPWGIYGSDAEEVGKLVPKGYSGNDPLHPSLPYRACEVIWAVRNEYARTVEDVLARRTRALFLDAAASITMAPSVARLMAGELGRSDAWQQEQVEKFRMLARRYLPA
jgi:glycerol-3-phosphate dehydrogenase